VPGCIEKVRTLRGAGGFDEAHGREAVGVDARRWSGARRDLEHVAFLAEEKGAAAVGQKGVRMEKAEGFFGLGEKFVGIAADEAAPRSGGEPGGEPGEAALGPGEFVAADELGAGVV